MTELSSEKLLYKAKSFQLNTEQKQEFLRCLHSVTEEIAANYPKEDRKDVHVSVKTASDISCAKELCMLYKDRACFEDHDFLVNIFNSKVKGDLKKEWDVLCGFLVVSHYHAQFLLFDPTTYVHVKFTETTTNLSNFNNTFVFIKKHVLITETTTDQRYQPLEYILVDAEDVQVVFTDIASKKQIFYDKNLTCNPGFLYVYLISINKVSGVLFGHKGKSECYIEAWVCAPSSKNMFLAFLVIPEELLTVTRFLNIATVYQIHSQRPWSNAEMCSYPELQRLRTAKVVLVIHTNSVFCETTLNLHMPQNIAALAGCQQLKEVISNTPDYGTISFELPLYKKTLKPKAFAPYFPARHQLMPYFGDLGYTEQTLVFKQDKQFVDLYLANRENHAVELGLIPNVVVRVNNAQVLKKRYVKTTIFTSFNVVKFCPPIKITSSMFRIYPKLGLGWLEQYPLSMLGNFENVPLGSVVGGQVYFHAIFDLSFCVTTQENGEDPDVKVHMIIEVEDGLNKKLTVELNCLDFLLDLLGWTSPLCRKAFMAEISQFKDCTVNFLKVSEKDAFLLRKSCKLMDKVVWLVRNHINFRLPLMLHLLCLRQSDKNYAKPYQVLCCRIITKLSRHPEMKMSDILFPQYRSLCYDC